MATPIAHASAGLACLAAVQLVMPARLAGTLPKLWLICAFAACAPDLDVLVSLAFTGSTTTWHSGPTHSLAFAFAVGLAVWLMQRAGPGRMVLAVVIGLATASHVLVDFLTGPQVGLHPSYGVPAFWPLLNDRVNSPVSVFRGVRHGGVAIWFEAHNLTTAAMELLFAVPVTVLSLWALKRPPLPYAGAPA